MQKSLFPISQYWRRVRDGNAVAFDIFSRHYTFRSERDGTGISGKLIAGPGEKLILLTITDDALFVWRKAKFRMDEQTGLDCAVFRNESKKYIASELIKDAERIAQMKWPGNECLLSLMLKKLKA